MPDILAYVTWLPAFLFVITVVVFFHELGHFAMARAFGVAVDSFSIGFGRELIGWTDRKGTRWKISLLPLGGYVRFAGDADATSRPDARVQALRATSATGPAAEGQLAFSSSGGSSVALAGSAPERNETVIEDRETEALANSLHFKPLYQRALVVAAGPVANFILAILIFAGIFMLLGKASDDPVVGSVLPGTAAEEAGVMVGDIIRTVNGQEIATFLDFAQKVEASGGQRMALGIERDGRDLVVEATPRATQEGAATVYRLGLGSGGGAREAVGPIEALAGGVERTWYIVDQTMTYLAQIVTGQARPDQLSGPIGIAKISGEVAERGLLELIGLAGLLSVSIGLINLFPIPMLDGGHLLYYAFEAVGRPLGERAQELGFRVGLAFVLCLMLLATFNDLVRFNLF